ncbi:hypothetical protein ROZALSC1DRAFT_30058 [Rozella allomycis CSF55]|uniref:ABC1 atypical kinase-like domain-containing protein n=1 Tax=Rozella allomycis (strain CSF55) TaxID=988480 RepID=A0A4P9YG96_ROZAC|nr:hypothetical protein ROZALSC1DRAFT_30058 [Rozella allomycis CSF55]
MSETKIGVSGKDGNIFGSIVIPRHKVSNLENENLDISISLIAGQEHRLSNIIKDSKDTKEMNLFLHSTAKNISSNSLENYQIPLSIRNPEYLFDTSRLSRNKDNLIDKASVKELHFYNDGDIFNIDVGLTLKKNVFGKNFNVYGRLPPLSLNGILVDTEIVSIDVASPSIEKETLKLDCKIQIRTENFFSVINSLVRDDSNWEKIKTINFYGKKGESFLSTVFSSVPFSFSLYAPLKDTEESVFQFMYQRLKYNFVSTENTLEVHVNGNWNENSVGLFEPDGKISWNALNASIGLLDASIPMSFFVNFSKGSLVMDKKTWKFPEANIHSVMGIKIGDSVNDITITKLLRMFSFGDLPEENMAKSDKFIRSLFTFAFVFLGPGSERLVHFTPVQPNPTKDQVWIREFIRKFIRLIPLENAVERISTLFLKEKDMILSILSNPEYCAELFKLVELNQEIKEKYENVITRLVIKYSRQVFSLFSFFLDKYKENHLQQKIFMKILEDVVERAISYVSEINLLKYFDEKINKLVGEDIDMKELPQGLVPVLKEFIQRYIQDIHYSVKFDILAAYLMTSSSATDAEKINNVLCHSGPFIQKLFQLLGDSVKHEEIKNLLSGLKTSIPPMDNDDFSIQILDTFQTFNEFDERFPTFNNDSIKAASVSQVHLAQYRSPDGQMHDVVVKVLRPYLTRKMHWEFSLLRNIAKKHGMINIVNEMIPSFEKELSFLQEYKNGVEGFKLYNESKGSLKSVKYFDPNEVIGRELSEEDILNVLVLEKAPGHPLSEILEHDLPIEKACFLINSIAKFLSRWFSVALFGTGFFHGDPHAGNVLISFDGESEPLYTVIDFGNAQRVDNEIFKPTYMKFGLAVLGSNTRDILNAFNFESIPKESAEYPEWLKLESELKERFNSEEYKEIDDVEEKFDKIVEIIGKYTHLSFPKKSIDFFKSKILIEKQFKIVADAVAKKSGFKPPNKLTDEQKQRMYLNEGKRILKEAKCPIPRLIDIFRRPVVTDALKTAAKLHLPSFFQVYIWPTIKNGINYALS